MMYHPEVQQREEGLSKAIVISIAAHVLVIAAFVVRMVIYPDTPLTLDNAIRVDIVALPDKAPKNVPMVETKVPPPPTPVPPAPTETSEPEAPKPVAIEPTKPVKTTKAPEKINLNSAKKQQDAALKRLEALERIEKMQKSAGRSAPQPLKGNQISHGSQLSGVVRLEQQSYLQTIDGSVKSHWNLPGFLSNANLSARARLFIDGKGNVVKRVITQSSHNDVYDSRVLAAIDAASPLPAPPSSLVNILEVDGIELEFVPN